jgi:hypothetical protein
MKFDYQHIALIVLTTAFVALHYYKPDLYAQLAPVWLVLVGAGIVKGSPLAPTAGLPTAGSSAADAFNNANKIASANPALGQSDSAKAKAEETAKK